VAVDANLGTVILQGVDSPNDVQLAQNVAASVPGVLSVEKDSSRNCRDCRDAAAISDPGSLLPASR
jgi:hypothetical protein